MMPPALGALRRSSRLGAAPWHLQHSHRTPAQSREEWAAPSFMQSEGSSTANKPQIHPDHDTSSTATHPENPGLGSADKAQDTRSDPGTPVGSHSPAWAAPARGGPARRWPLAHPRSRSAHGSLPKTAPGCSRCRCVEVLPGEAWKSPPSRDIQADVPGTGASTCSSLGAHPRAGGKKAGEGWCKGRWLAGRET